MWVEDIYYYKFDILYLIKLIGIKLKYIVFSIKYTMRDTDNIIRTIIYLNSEHLEHLEHLEQIIYKVNYVNTTTPLDRMIYIKTMLIYHNKEIQLLRSLNRGIYTYYQQQMNIFIKKIHECISRYV